MSWPVRWIDGLRGRIAAALLAALFVQFVGGEIIFKQLETDRMQRNRAERLAERLVMAEELIATNPDNATIALMHKLWRNRLTVTRTVAAPALPPSGSQDELEEIHARIAAALPGIATDSLRLVRIGNTLEGVMQARDGSWLHFRSEGHFKGNPMMLHYTASVLLLLGCVVLIALLFGRMIARPLHQIVEAAETVRRDEPVSVTVEGPREVRQVASAFEAMQARLLAHVRERVQSLAAMSHDLRTPLARLQLNASLVEDQETRAAIEQDVAEMGAFVTSILDYLRGDDPEPEQLADISSIILTVIDEARDLGANVTFSGPERMERVTRPLKLKRLIRNIVQNAVRHGGNARVKLEIEHQSITIIVEDDGPGIPEDKWDAVFEPFVRIESSRNRQTGGAGLGLAIARQLAGRLGGSIGLGNLGSGGLRVAIRLPDEDLSAPGLAGG
ncbi:MAG: ATP-binding protein [Novosphingobium sp.]